MENIITVPVMLPFKILRNTKRGLKDRTTSTWLKELQKHNKNVMLLLSLALENQQWGKEKNRGKKQQNEGSKENKRVQSQKNDSNPTKQKIVMHVLDHFFLMTMLIIRSHRLKNIRT